VPSGASNLPSLVAPFLVYDEVYAKFTLNADKLGYDSSQSDHNNIYYNAYRYTNS
jgi:hypothetical protein